MYNAMKLPKSGSVVGSMLVYLDPSKAKISILSDMEYLSSIIFRQANHRPKLMFFSTSAVRSSYRSELFQKTGASIIQERARI